MLLARNRRNKNNIFHVVQRLDPLRRLKPEEERYGVGDRLAAAIRR